MGSLVKASPTPPWPCSRTWVPRSHPFPVAVAVAEEKGTVML